MTVASALALGIAVDRAVSPVWPLWMAALSLALLLAAVCERRGRARSAALLLAAAALCVGGARHHAVWSLRADDEVARFAREEPQPVRLVATLATPVSIRAADREPSTPDWMRIDRSVCEIECEALVREGQRIPASGRARLDVSGHLLHAGVGDRVEVLGRMAAPSPPRNPGAFDFLGHLRRQGIGCLVRCDHPEGVRRLEDGGGGLGIALARWRGELRSECEWVLRRQLSPRTFPLAASLLLGDRSQMPDETRTAFAESGTLHLLAISGLHVGILAGLVLLVARLANLSPAATAALVVAAILTYAFVADHRPPVQRAAVLACVTAAALARPRPVNGMNTLALCAIVILLWRPADLFDIGAQLSFLAVAGIVHVSGWTGGRWRELLRRRAVGLGAEQGRLARMLRPLATRLGDGYLVTGAIWLMTLPLTLATFHIAAPVGFLANVALVPYTAVVLACGFLLLLAGFLAPWIAAAPGAAFDLTLAGMLDLVEWSARTPLGAVYVPGPPRWWLAGWYALLAVAIGVIRPGESRFAGGAGSPWRRLAWRGLAVWTVAGLALGLLPHERTGLRCTFLSVGHGCAVVLELPNGRTLLYDAGTLGEGRLAQRTVQEALWSRGVSRLDAVVISHADVDHFNGVPGLLQTTAVGSVLISQSFLDFSQPSVELLCEAAQRRGVPLRLLHRGDRLLADRDVAMEVLHPPPGEGDPLDNANSIVLRVRYAGRTVLLTGDLEGSGLAALLERPPEAVDVLLSPHHGGRAANPPELAAWARPRYAVVSTGLRRSVAPLRDIYGEGCVVLSTAESGAVTVEVSPTGELRVKEFRRGR